MGAVTTHGLTKDFRAGFWRPTPRRALDTFSIEVPEGGVFGLLGPNGAGKSTVLKLLVGLLKPSAGSAALLGVPAGTVDIHRRIGFLPENPTFSDRLTAEELLIYFAGLFGTPAVTGVGVPHACWTSSESRPTAGVPFARTQGMIQRVGLAQALVNDPELVLLDEPMSGLDPIGRRQVAGLVAALGAEGRTVVVSSHILADAERLCGHVAILARGRLVVAGRTDALTSNRVLGWRLVFHRGSAVFDRHDARMERLDDDRFTIALDGSQRPEPVIAEFAAAGAALESVVPRGETLEEAFVRALGGAGSAGDVETRP